MSANPARLATVRALVSVEEGAHLDAALAELAPDQGGDRELTWFLAYGVTRRRSEVDAALRARLSRPLTGLDPAVRAVLRVGAFERLFARTAPHAAVHQAVEVMKAVGPARAAGMVNAVVRRVSEATNLRDAERHNLPDWLWERWVDRYGREEAEAWARDATEPPPLFVVARRPDEPLPGALGPEGLEQIVGGPPGVYRCSEPSSRVEAWRGYAEGAWWIQDLAAVRVADLAGEVADLRVLDAFAAPGGKAFRLASRGARVCAVDRDAARLTRLREGAARVHVSLDIRRHDWRDGPGDLPDDFDVVLVDAPCSALGTLRRHPEVRWRRQPTDLAAAGQRQGELLARAATRLRPGGILVYAVCSPEPEEGPEVVEAFVAARPDFAIEAMLLTAPPVIGEDAHYGCRLRRLP